MAETETHADVMARLTRENAQLAAELARLRSGEPVIEITETGSLRVTIPGFRPMSHYPETWAGVLSHTDKILEAATDPGTIAASKRLRSLKRAGNGNGK